MKILAGILGGFILAVLGAMLVTITLAAGQSGPGMGVGAFFLFWALGIAIAVMAPRAAKAWRRILVTGAVLAFLLPIGGMIYTGAFVATKTDSGAAAAGATIGGGLVTGALGVFGFFLGAVFLIIGLLVGRDKEVVYVQAPPGALPPGAATTPTAT